MLLCSFSEAGNPRDIPVANHKAIHGLCVDPTSPQRLATYTEVEERERGGGGGRGRQREVLSHVCVCARARFLIPSHCRARCTYGTSDTLQNQYPFHTLFTRATSFSYSYRENDIKRACIMRSKFTVINAELFPEC